MYYRTLGRTGLRVSEIGLGTWAIGGNSYGTTSDKESLEAIAYALDHGVNFIDTADIYGSGKAEELIGRIIRGRTRGEIVIATKGGWDYSQGAGRQNYSPDYLRSAIDASLKRLGIDTIDLYQFHNPPDTLLENPELVLDVLEGARREGKIRFIGVSIYVARQGIAWVNTGRVDSIQCIYNLIDQRVEREFFPLAQEKNIGVIAREPLNCGILTGKYSADAIFPKNDHRRRWTREKITLDLEKAAIFEAQFPEFKKERVRFALSFIFSHPTVSVVIPGAKSVEQVRENLAASVNGFSAEVFGRLRDIYQRVPIFKQGFYRE